MKRVGVFEGKAHFSALIEEARSGETIIVTKNGSPVAQICPLTSATARSKQTSAMKRILSSKATLGGISIRELIDKGRAH
jgi:prevent-host-death family protein